MMYQNEGVQLFLVLFTLFNMSAFVIGAMVGLGRGCSYNRLVEFTPGYVLGCELFRERTK